MKRKEKKKRKKVSKRSRARNVESGFFSRFRRKSILPLFFSSSLLLLLTLDDLAGSEGEHKGVATVFFCFLIFFLEGE